MPENITVNIKGMRGLADNKGAVFDVDEHQAQAFEDSFEHANESGKSLDFDVHKCTNLPELFDKDNMGGP